MTAMAYSGYDGGFNRSLSRRQSVAYGAAPYAHQGMYTEPMMPHALADYPQPSYQIYGPPNGTVPMSHRLTGPSYEDLDIRDPYYPDERQLSSGHLPMIPHSTMSMGRPRHRRHSTVSFASRPPPLRVEPGNLKQSNGYPYS